MRNPIHSLIAAGALAGATALVATPTEARTVVSFGVGVPVYGGYYAPPVAIGYGYGPYWRGAYRPYWHRPYWGRPWGWRRGWYGRPYGWRRW